MWRVLSALLAATLLACGATPDKPLDKDEIRRNADDANAELDQESSRKADDR